MVKDPPPSPLHHRQALDRWLQARAAGESGDDLPHGRELYRAVGELTKWRPESFEVLHRLYLSPNPEPELAQRWADLVRAGPSRKGSDAMLQLRYLQSARAFLLHTLYINAQQRARRARLDAGAEVCADCGQRLPETSPQSREVRL